MRKYIEIGKIVNTHGINGTVKAEPWCDSPDVLAKMPSVFTAPAAAGESFREYKITKGSVQKNHVLLVLEGIETVEAAAKLKNTLIYADRANIPINEGGHLIDDLKGLSVIDIDSGRVYGKIKDVITNSANDIYEIDTESGSVLFPAVGEFVKSIDLDKGVFIRPIGGMFDEN